MRGRGRPLEAPKPRKRCACGRLCRATGWHTVKTGAPGERRQRWRARCTTCERGDRG